MNHCKLQLFLEEISMLEGFNIFTLGSSECSFFSLKTRLKPPAINASYNLSSTEVIFGDLTRVSEEIEKIMRENDLKTIILITCIPSIMNLDLSDLINLYPDRLISFQIPEFSGYSAVDFIPNIYYELFKNEKIDDFIDGVAIWENEFYTTDEIKNMLKYKGHIIKKYKYLKLLESLRGKYPYQIKDETSFSYSSFMAYVRKNSSLIDTYNNFISVISRRNDWIIISNYYYELSSILRQEGIGFKRIILSSITKREHDLLKELDENIIVEFSSSFKYLDNENTFNTTDFDYEYYQYDINEAVIEVMRRYLDGNK